MFGVKNWREHAVSERADHGTQEKLLYEKLEKKKKKQPVIETKGCFYGYLFHTTTNLQGITVPLHYVLCCGRDDSNAEYFQTEQWGVFPPVGFPFEKWPDCVSPYHSFSNWIISILIFENISTLSFFLFLLQRWLNYELQRSCNDFKILQNNNLWLLFCTIYNLTQ